MKIINAEDTIAFLRRYNEWRRGSETMDQPEPKEVGEHLEAAATHLARLETLSQHSVMLGRIAGLVHEFTEEDEDTTLTCVARLCARYYDQKANGSWEYLEKLEREEGRE